MRAATWILPIVAGALVAPATIASATVPSGDGVYPLTGLPVDDPATAGRPALVVTIDNCCGDTAYRQSGLDDADIVFEYEAEGTTRLAAVFNSGGSDPVGPIRSARTTEIDLLASLGGVVLATSGGNEAVVSALAATDFVVLGQGDGMFRDDVYPAPHNLFANTSELFELAGDAAPATAPFDHDVAVPAGEAASFIDIAFAAVPVTWEYDVEAETYFRQQHGAQHTLGDDSWVSTDNVVVLGVEYVWSAADSRSPEAFTVGSGPVVVYRNGVAVTGEWSRATRTDPFTLTDAAGAPITLTPGRTWVELVGPLPAT
ncbi:DUF3048 domain-containing protein [Desertimonas flava]|uniref:DUF3048 domain-containing protein n=1 Tax=Desertimonas flava TaxID=2064846 RepID=UPI000E3429E8|nr:DUF3048 domain-containing protein [Desertimonas flava]